MSDNWRTEYPFTSRYLGHEGARIHYIDEGQGPVLLLVHGNPTWSFHWRRLVCAFRDRYRMVALDHLGCGFSDKPQERDYCLAERIEDLLDFIELLDLHHITLVAQDWGGAIGLGAALRIPHRFDRLVLFNTGAFPPPYVPWQLRLFRIPVLGTWAVRRGNLFLLGALRYAMARPDRLTPNVRAGYLAPYPDWASRVAIDRFVKDIPLSQRHRTWQTLCIIESGLPFLARRPVCLLWGMKDWCFRPECLQRFLKSFPRAEVHRLDAAGHWVVEDACEEVLDRLEAFLRRTDRRDD
jgi:haloalkane dehalogenase